MKCEECKDLLWLYLDNTLTAEEETVVVDHIEHCADCKGELENIKEMKEMLDSLPEVDLPEGYHGTLMEKIKAEQQKETKVISLAERKKDKFKWKNMGLVAAAICLVVVGSTTGNFFNMGSDSASSSSAPMAVAESRMMEESVVEDVEMATGSTTTTESMDMTADAGMMISGEVATESALSYQEEWQVVAEDMDVFVAEIQAALAEVDGVMTLQDMDYVEVMVSVEHRDALLALLEETMETTVCMVEDIEGKQIFIRIGCSIV